IRILCSASNAARAFDLRCEMREKIISFIAQTYPTALPHLRAELKTADAVGNIAVTTPMRAQA
ncbi:MAG: mechanosensitive ion channel family protein, partial [Pararhizobium sp.]